jgi:two-component system, OmpR family, sensor histidine kinase KdpD
VSTAPPASPGSSTRALAAALLGVVGLAGLTAVLVPHRGQLALASMVLLYLVVVVAVAVVGGLWVALAAALASDLLVNFFLVPPYHTFTVEHRDNVITLLVYVAVASTVAVAVDLAARQRAAAARNGIESDVLARITASPVGAGSLAQLLTHVRDTLRMTSAALLETTAHGEQQVVAAVGPLPSARPALSVPAGDGISLVIDGPPVFAPDPRFLGRLAAAAARTLQAERLAAEAAAARELAEIDRLRAALLTAVGHDLRTPLAGIKAGVSSLRQTDLDLTNGQRAELLATVEESADRMEALVENLLAMSRLRAGSISIHPQPMALGDVTAAALLHTPGILATVDVPDDLPLVRADPGLLERAIANVLANAHRASPEQRAVELVSLAAGDRVELHIVDHGRGVAAADRDRMFQPFQRLDDRTTEAGLGLGLAISQGFLDAMGGTITPVDTPGGGLTMIISVPRASDTP